jgi:hypothetical protein
MAKATTTSQQGRKYDEDFTPTILTDASDGMFSARSVGRKQKRPAAQANKLYPVDMHGRSA